MQDLNTISIKLTDDQRARLNSKAQSRGVNIEDFVSELIISSISEPAEIQEPPAKPERILGLHEGNILYISDDFDDPLPDSFWFGEE